VRRLIPILFLCFFFNQACADGAELIYNGGAESTPIGWINRGAAEPVRSTDHAHAGTYSFKAELGMQTASDRLFYLSAGKTYKASAWIWGGPTVEINMFVTGGDNSYIIIDEEDMPASWSYREMTFTVVYSGSGNYLVEIYDVFGEVGSYFYVDDVSLVEQASFTGGSLTGGKLQ